MKEVYSSAEDCYLLASNLKKKLESKISFYGSTYSAIPCGKYLSSYRKNNGEYMFNGHYLPFYFKFSENEFLRISVGANYSGSSLGERMAALSDFYVTLSEKYGEPTVFYTTKNDDKELLTLQWSFIDKEQEIKKFKDGTYFDDAEVDILIIFGQNKENIAKYSLNDKTKEMISRKIGLPFELIYLVDEDIENFVKYKNGKQIAVPVDAKVDCVLVTSFEKKLVKRN